MFRDRGGAILGGGAYSDQVAPSLLRTAFAAALAALMAGAVLWPGASSAGHQTPKNGCTSAARISGSLTSPTFTSSFSSFNQVVVDFQTWWEIEGRQPATFDQLKVWSSINGGPFTLAGTLNPASSPGAAPDVPLSSAGLQTRPAWEPVSIELPQSGGATSVQIRFTFDSVTANFNGFRGWGIDDIVISDGFGSPNPVTVNFDASPGLPAGWTASGFWHVQDNPQAVSIAPGINPQLVTLGAGDDGTLPAAFSGTRMAWFGQAATGTYCGTGSPAENFAPSASFGVGPSAPRTSDVVSFDGTSSSDLDGPVASYTWDFGDGSPAGAGPTASHVYTRAGTYTVSLTVADAAGATSTASAPVQVGTNLPDGILVADKLDDLPNPRPFREVNVEPTDGQVFIQIDGRASAAQVPGTPRGFIPLTQAAQVPIRSILETSNGKVMVESARDRRARRTQRAEFFDGRFQTRQPRVRRGALITEMVLKGGSFRACPRARQSASWSRANDAQRRRRSRVRRLWGNGRGRFRTRGRYSSATVRGTTWLTEDRCDGTLTRLPRRPRTSRVDVRDLVQRRTIRLRAGRSYLARPRAARRR